MSTLQGLCGPSSVFFEKIRSKTVLQPLRILWQQKFRASFSERDCTTFCRVKSLCCSHQTRKTRLSQEIRYWQRGSSISPKDVLPGEDSQDELRLLLRLQGAWDNHIDTRFQMEVTRHFPLIKENLVLVHRLMSGEETWRQLSVALLVLFRGKR